MGHPMFEYDATLADEVFDYCRDRLSMDPVPLDFGSLNATAPGDMKGFIRPEGHDADEILEFFKNDLAPAVVSIDSPGSSPLFRTRPPRTRCCSTWSSPARASTAPVGWSRAASYWPRIWPSSTSRSWPACRGLRRRVCLRGSLGNLSSLTVGRDIGRAKHPNLLPHEVRYAISADAHSSIGKALHVLGVQPLIVTTDDHRFTRASLEQAMADDPNTENVIGIVATSGTTNAGIVDDLEGLGSYAANTICGSTSTVPTAGPRCSHRPNDTSSRGCDTPTASSSTRTSGSSGRSTAAR